MDGLVLNRITGSVCLRNALDEPWQMLLKFTQTRVTEFQHSGLLKHLLVNVHWMVSLPCVCSLVFASYHKVLYLSLMHSYPNFCCGFETQRGNEEYFSL